MYFSNTIWLVPSLKYTLPYFTHSSNNFIIKSLSNAMLSIEVCLAIRMLSWRIFLFCPSFSSRVSWELKDDSKLFLSCLIFFNSSLSFIWSKFDIILDKFSNTLEIVDFSSRDLLICLIIEFNSVNSASVLDDRYSSILKSVKDVNSKSISNEVIILKYIFIKNQ